MTAGLNYCLAGLPIWGMDQGGFTPEDRYGAVWYSGQKDDSKNADLKEWRELQTRWSQFGAFVPLYRAHGQVLYREPWNIAPDNHPAYKSIVYYDRLRYRLMPYIYSLNGAIHFKDYTMMRALVMDYGQDTQVLDIKDQWMFGPALMACPVSQYGARSRQVYLPKQNGWYDLYTNTYYDGGRLQPMLHTSVSLSLYRQVPFCHTVHRWNGLTRRRLQRLPFMSMLVKTVSLPSMKMKVPTIIMRRASMPL